MAGLITLFCMPANAAHELLYAVDQYNNLFSFYSDAPGTIISQRAINGVQNTEEIRGLDYYGGALYGLGSFSSLYTLDPDTGVATQVGSTFSTILNGATFGDDNGPGGYRIVSNLGQSLLVDRTTGAAIVAPALAYASGDPNFGVSPRADALAYDPVTGDWYAADTLQNTLALLDPTTGLLSTIGSLGIDASRFNGLDISAVTDIMYMDTPAASSDPQANLYTIDKASGQVTLVGQIGNPGDDILVRGLTVAPAVPEPGSLTLLGLGVAGLLLAYRRRQ